jgi:hypothetical protein
VSEQSVPTHADTQTSTYPVKKDRGNYRRPAPEKERCHSSQMRNDEKNAVGPINRTPCRGYRCHMFFQFHFKKLSLITYARGI